MNIITIKTQAEFDALPDRFEKCAKIYIESDKNLWLQVSREIQGATIEAWGNSHVVAREISHVEAWENSHVEARGNSHVEAWGSSHVEARENSHVEARENSHVEARGRSHIVAWEKSHVEAREISHVEAWENSHVVARGNSHVEAWESSHVEAWESSHVEARERSHIEASMNAIISVWSKYAVIESLKDYATVVCVGEKCTIKKRAKTATVKVNPNVEYDIESFAGIYHANLTDNSTIILYKSVNPETSCDFCTGKIKYDGTVTCPDWDPDPERECGGGLHLSPTPDLALSFNRGKVLKCEVALKDIVVYGRNINKVRCREVRVIGEVQEARHV